MTLKRADAVQIVKEKLIELGIDPKVEGEGRYICVSATIPNVSALNPVAGKVVTGDAHVVFRFEDYAVVRGTASRGQKWAADVDWLPKDLVSESEAEKALQTKRKAKDFYGAVDEESF